MPRLMRILSRHFNPRSPQGERHLNLVLLLLHLLFQSTLPAGGATRRLAPSAVFLHFNPRSPQGERHIYSGPYAVWRNFNPRSPQGERRQFIIPHADNGGFQSTLPAGGATFLLFCSLPPLVISIHAPRRGSDLPRILISFVLSRFQSTLPAGGATLLGGILANKQQHFNPRSPQGERQARIRRDHAEVHFNPRSPQGERHKTYITSRLTWGISIHAPRRGSDLPIV